MKPIWFFDSTKGNNKSLETIVKALTITMIMVNFSLFESQSSQ
jgi:hypothetical protein